MSGFSPYTQNLVIDAIFRGQTLTPPTTIYFALILDASQGGNEVNTGSYARSPVGASLANFAGTQAAGSTSASSGTSGQTSNNTPIPYPVPTADWGKVAQVWVFDAPSGGNLLIKGTLTNPKTINNGDPAPVFPPGAFVFGLTNAA